MFWKLHRASANGKQMKRQPMSASRFNEPTSIFTLYEWDLISSAFCRLFLSSSELTGELKVKPPGRSQTGTFSMFVLETKTCLFVFLIIHPFTPTFSPAGVTHDDAASGPTRVSSSSFPLLFLFSFSSFSSLSSFPPLYVLSSSFCPPVFPPFSIRAPSAPPRGVTPVSHPPPPMSLSISPPPPPHTHLLQHRHRVPAAETVSLHICGSLLKATGLSVASSCRDRRRR